MTDSHIDLLQSPEYKNLQEFKYLDWVPDKSWKFYIRTYRNIDTCLTQSWLMPLFLGSKIIWLASNCIVLRKFQLFPVKTLVDKQYTQI